MNHYLNMKTLLFFLLPGILLVSCSKERITGNDVIITETRDISGFTGVHSSGSNRIHIAYGTDFKVEIKGSSNLVPVYESAVRNNILELGYRNGVNVHGNDIEIFLTMPLVKSVSLSGSGDVNIAGDFPDTTSFQLTVSGSADVEVKDTINCNSVNVNISGSGGANLAKMLAKHADVTISGSGNVRVSAEQELKVRISGSGDVYYDGNPTVSSDISGSGKVRHL